MYELFGTGSPNVLKIVMMLEELEAPYSFKFINTWKGEQFSDAFTSISPNAKVPVLADRSDDANATYIFESGAILIHLAEKAGAFLGGGNPQKRSEILQWLIFQVANIGPTMGQFGHFAQVEPEASDYARRRFASETVRLLDVIEQRLERSAYLGCDEYSIADIATFPWIFVAQTAGFPLDGRPALARWMHAIGDRPATARALVKAKELRGHGEELRAAATDEDKDRLFRRGAFDRTPPSMTPA